MLKKNMEFEGVVFNKLVRNCDDRGFFSEIVRDDENLVERFGQMSVSKTNAGVIKAFHYHKYQDDIWFFPSGNVRAVLYDQREDSESYGLFKEYFMGEDNPSVLIIPKGVAHGYQVLGNEPATIVYSATKAFNHAEPDEGRIPYDSVDFDWRVGVKDASKK